MEFEWDNNKEASNIKKHRVSFTAAAQLLMNKHYAVRSDRDGEARYLAVGELNGRILAVAYTKRGDKYRIISARRAGKHEEATYRENSELQST